MVVHLVLVVSPKQHLLLVEASRVDILCMAVVAPLPPLYGTANFLEIAEVEVVVQAHQLLLLEPQEDPQELVVILKICYRAQQLL